MQNVNVIVQIISIFMQLPIFHIHTPQAKQFCQLHCACIYEAIFTFFKFVLSFFFYLFIYFLLFMFFGFSYLSIYVYVCICICICCIYICIYVCVCVNVYVCVYIYIYIYILYNYIYYIFFPLPLFVCGYRFSTRCILTICNLIPDFPFVKLHSKWPPV